MGPSDPLSRAVALMTACGVRHIAVVDAGKVVGILALGDVDPHLGQLEWTPVRLAMSAPPTTVSPDMPIARVVDALLDGGFDAIPVVAGGALAGMITRHDLLRLIAARA